MTPESAQLLIGAALAALEGDPKRADLARIGYRNPNGSKLNSTKNSRGAGADRFDRDVIKARRKLERDRKRDQRRKARR